MGGIPFIIEEVDVDCEKKTSLIASINEQVPRGRAIERAYEFPIENVLKMVGGVMDVILQIIACLVHHSFKLRVAEEAAKVIIEIVVYINFEWTIVGVKKSGITNWGIWSRLV